MSLETLLEAARFVEQQELRAKQILNVQNLNNNHQINRSSPFKIVTSVATINHTPLTVSHPQISQSPPATLVAVPQVPSVVQQPSIPTPSHSVTVGASLQNCNGVQAPRQPGALHQVQNSSVMMAAQPGVVEVIQKPLTSTITIQPQQVQTITNGFDKATTFLLEDNQMHTNHVQNQDSKKRNHNATGMMRSGTREVHNKLEKNRRAHLKECFEMLKKQLPPQQDEKKTSNLSILHSALRHIQGLKKKERENEHEMERLARDKIASQQRLAALKKELGPQWDNIDFSTLIQPPEPPLLAIATTTNTNLQNIGMPVVTSSIMATISPDILVPPQNPIKEEFFDSDEPITRVTSILTNGNSIISSNGGATTLQSAQLSVPMLPLPQVGYPVSQGLVLGVQKVALVSSKNLPLVSSPIAHILPQLNGKVVPLMNAQYLMKPVVVVSTPSQGNTNITSRPS